MSVLVKVQICSHAEVVQVNPFPDTRIWHRESSTWCSDRPETLKTTDAVLTPVGRV
jgi:hypothetical protein